MTDVDIATGVEEPIELSEVEQEAITKGWSPDGPKSADEFLRAEPLYEEIKARGREIKDLKSTVDSMKSLMDKQQQKAYDQAIKDIEASRREAIESGDIYQVEQLEQSMADLKGQQAPSQMTSEMSSFVERHDNWIKEQSPEAEDMRLMAEAKYLVLKNQNIPDHQIVEQVESSLKRAYPERFKVRGQPPIVESPSNQTASIKAAGKRKFSFNDLSADQKRVCSHFKRNNVMTEAEYINELVRLGELNHE